jgi:hypothetical protein
VLGCEQEGVKMGVPLGGFVGVCGPHIGHQGLRILRLVLNAKRARVWPVAADKEKKALLCKKIQNMKG